MSTTTKKPAEKAAAPAAKPAEKPAAAPANTNEKKPEEKKSNNTDDLFGASSTVLHEAGGLASSEMRLWSDNTGHFSCHARLVQFLSDHVRLLKDNGHTTTVPLARLSTRDLEFVNRQASAKQAEVRKTAQMPVTMPTLTN